MRPPTHLGWTLYVGSILQYKIAVVMHVTLYTRLPTVILFSCPQGSLGVRLSNSCRLRGRGFNSHVGTFFPPPFFLSPFFFSLLFSPVFSGTPFCLAPISLLKRYCPTSSQGLPDPLRGKMWKLPSQQNCWLKLLALKAGGLGMRLSYHN